MLPWRRVAVPYVGCIRYATAATSCGPRRNWGLLGTPPVPRRNIKMGTLSPPSREAGSVGHSPVPSPVSPSHFSHLSQERVASYVLLEPESDGSSEIGPVLRPPRLRQSSRDRRPSLNRLTPRRHHQTRPRASRASHSGAHRDHRRPNEHSAHPRGWILLPLVAAVDTVTVATLAGITWYKHARHWTDQPAHLATRLLVLLSLAALVRDAILGTLGLVPSPRRFAHTVAALSLVRCVGTLVPCRGNVLLTLFGGGRHLYLRGVRTCGRTCTYRRMHVGFHSVFIRHAQPRFAGLKPARSSSTTFTPTSSDCPSAQGATA